MPHIHEKVDFTVEVFIVHKNKVLLRKHDKYKTWLSVGGHIELDEDPNQAAVREVKEEVGLDVFLHNHSKIELVQHRGYTELIPPVFMNRHNINENHEHITLTYFARSNTDILVPCEDEKSDECKWFTLKELDLPEFGILERIKFYAKSALNCLKD